MKKILSLLCALMLTFSTTIAFANPNLLSTSANNSQINQRLIQIGFSQAQLDLMSDGVKANIANDNTVESLIDFKTSTLTERCDKPTINSIGVIQATGTIPTSDLQCNIISVGISHINGKPAIRLYQDFRWLTIPIYTLTDHICIAWSEGWYANSYDIQVNYTDSLTKRTGTISGYPYSIQRTGGIAWNYDISTNMFSSTSKPSGYAYVNLTKEDPNLIPSAESCAEGMYVHDYFTPAVSISVTPSESGGVLPGISQGGDSTNDVAVRSTSWVNSSIQ